jgi:polar amino acid transport system substrate-binding protein
MTQSRFLAGVLAVVAAVSLAAAPAAVADTILSDVLSRGTLRIAVNTGNPPRSMLDASGQLVGYDIDLANELVKALGVKAEFIRTDVAGRVALLQAHKADVTIATFTPTLERMKTVAFTDAYTVDGLQLMTRADRNELNSPKDFNRPDIKIGLGRGSTAAAALAKFVPQAKVVEFPGLADVMQAIDSRQVDATCTNDGLVAETVKQSGGKFKPIAEKFGIEDDAIGLPQGDFVWWSWLNAFVHQINEDGTNYTLFRKWFGVEPMPFVKAPPKTPS